MRSHLTAFGVGAALSLVAAGAFALIAPRIAAADDDGDGVRIINTGDGGSGSFHLKDDALNIAAEWKRDFSFAADGRSLTALDGKLEVVSKENGVERKAVFAVKSGAIAASFFRDDAAVPAGPDADREAGDLLQLFARSSGVNADSRVKALIAAGGKAAVMDEIGKLVGDHAAGAYIEALAGAAALTDDDVRVLAERVIGLDSDYAKRTALAALLDTRTLSEAATRSILDAAKTIEGDHELRLIVDDLAGKEMSARNFSVAATLIGEIEGDHEVRLAVGALLENEGLADADAARAIDAAAAAIEGDHELRLVIDAADDRLRGDDVGAAGLRAIDRIDGAHERRLAIESFAGALDENAVHWLALIEAAKAVDSDHERRLTLEAIGSEAPRTDEIRAALRKTAQTIESDHDRRLALEALE